MSEELSEECGQSTDALIGDDRHDRRAFALPKESTSLRDIERRFADARGKIEARVSHKKIRYARSPEQGSDLGLRSSAREILGDA